MVQTEADGGQDEGGSGQDGNNIQVYLISKTYRICWSGIWKPEKSLECFRPRVQNLGQ